MIKRRARFTRVSIQPSKGHIQAFGAETALDYSSVSVLKKLTWTADADGEDYHHLAGSSRVYSSVDSLRPDDH